MISVAKMRLCRCESFVILLINVFLPLFVLSETSKEEQTQFYWKKKGNEEIQRALEIKLNEKDAKNIILFVGDGLGPNTLTATRIYRGGESSELAFEKFPHVAILKTYAVDATVPDSACTATALFSGVKTNVEVSGVDAGVKLDDCQSSLKEEHRISNIIDWAQQAGKDTGFVTTTRVTHATPGALYSHTANRKWECDVEMPPSASHCKDIARQLIEDEPGRNFKVIMGGGRQCLTWMITNTTNDPIEAWACKRADGRDLLTEWKKDKVKKGKTFHFVNNTQDLQSLDYENTDFVMGNFLKLIQCFASETAVKERKEVRAFLSLVGLGNSGIFANGHMMYEDKRDKTSKGMPSLKEMTRAAIKILQKNKNGYVLMVEGGLIDMSHHRGYARRALEETAQFADAVAEAVRLTSDDDTLIIVTSDHSHNLNINGKSYSRSDILGIAMNSGVDGVPYTKLTYSTGERKNYQYIVRDGKVQRKDPTADDTYSFDYSHQAGIVNDEATHGGADVALFAKGPLSHLFHGIHEQTYVAYVMAYAAKIGSYRDRQNTASSCEIPATGSPAVKLAGGPAVFFSIILSLNLREN